MTKERGDPATAASSLPTFQYRRYPQEKIIEGDSLMAWPEPLHSRSQVRKAGKRITKAYRENDMPFVGWQISPEDYQIVENWRASHGAVLNTAQAWLRRLDMDNSPVVGQRLKRYGTMVDKLKTGRAKDLSSMHDIAGVRAIFRNEDDLRSFQERAMASRAKHKLMHDIGKYDYIESAKPTGYRGVHHVYSRQSPSASGIPWNGMKFEVQFRTAVQHAWATAVEVYDSTAQARFKFENSENPAYEQFLLISELFARVHEGRFGCLSEVSDMDLFQRERALEKQTHMVATIDSLVVADNYGRLEQNSILQRTKNGELYVHRFSSLPSAIRSIARIEDLDETENAVLVGATTPSHIRVAFRNYFDDTKDFVDLLFDAYEQIGIVWQDSPKPH